MSSALEPVEPGERDGFDRLHAVATEPGKSAHAIDGPGDEVSGSRFVRSLLGDEALAFDGRVGFGGDTDAPPVGVDQKSVVRETEHQANGGGLEPERSPADAGALAGLLHIRQCVLKALQPRPTAGRVLTAQICKLYAVVSACTANSPGHTLAGDDQLLLVDGRGVAQVVKAGELEQPALGREADAGKIDVAGLALTRCAKQSARPMAARPQDAGGPVEPVDLVWLGVQALDVERAAQCSRKVRLGARGRGRNAPVVEQKRERQQKW